MWTSCIYVFFENQEIEVEPSRRPFIRNMHSGNCVATRTVLGLLLGVARGVHFLLEQPSSSVMVYLPVMEHLMNSMTRLGLAQPAAVRLLLASICTCTVRVWAAAGACTCVCILNLNVPVSWMGLLGAKSMKRTVLVATVPHACE